MGQLNITFPFIIEIFDINALRFKNDAQDIFTQTVLLLISKLV